MYLAVRGLKPRAATLLLAIAFLVQIADLSPAFLPVRERYVTHRSWRSPLSDPFWAVAVSRYQTIVVVPDPFAGSFRYEPIAYIAAQHHIQTNCAMSAQIPLELVYAVRARREEALRGNLPDRKTLYLIPEDTLFHALAKVLGNDHGVGTINGYNVIAPYWFADGKAAGPGDLKPGGG